MTQNSVLSRPRHDCTRGTLQELTLEGYLQRQILNCRAIDQVACHIIELKNWEKKQCVMFPSLPFRAEADSTGEWMSIVPLKTTEDKSQMLVGVKVFFFCRAWKRYKYATVSMCVHNSSCNVWAATWRQKRESAESNDPPRRQTWLEFKPSQSQCMDDFPGRRAGPGYPNCIFTAN